MTNTEFINALRRAYSQLDYYSFCSVVGELPDFNGVKNAYAWSKWEAFQDIAHGINNMGTYLDKVVEYGNTRV